jgi:phospholipase A1
LSREWNQIYLDSIFYYGNLIATLRLWYPDAGENNPDIADYLGYGHLKLNYILGKHQFDLTWRNNLHFDGDNRGSIEGEWSYPIGHSKSNFWYLKAFSGYGASLMDYNHHQNRFGFGFLFSR